VGAKETLNGGHCLVPLGSTQVAGRPKPRSRGFSRSVLGPPFRAGYGSMFIPLQPRSRGFSRWSLSLQHGQWLKPHREKPRERGCSKRRHGQRPPPSTAGLRRCAKSPVNGAQERRQLCVDTNGARAWHLIRTPAARAVPEAVVAAEQVWEQKDRREARLVWAAHPRVWAATGDYQAALPAMAQVVLGQAWSLSSVKEAQRYQASLNRAGIFLLVRLPLMGMG